ncbi:unnamed protein product [Trichobilharzia szidati]|nr:unnamed protein product [Trichobilharzia szidati]
MHYSTKQFGYFTLFTIIVLHAYIFLDDAKAYLVNQYYGAVMLFSNLFDEPYQSYLHVFLTYAPIVVFMCTMICSTILIGLWIIYKTLKWIVYNAWLEICYPVVCLLKYVMSKVVKRMTTSHQDEQHIKAE